MGVKDLWKVLRPAASTESITRLAVDGFTRNVDGNRGLRIGIDASIWFGHTEKIKNRGKMGKNHSLRTLFFRCTHMLEVPLLPLFVFDGKGKPLVKRGKASHFKKSKLVEDMQELLDAFGFQWHLAPGEAEAELAYLNTIGVIDIVWTDDVDVFLFGAMRVIRNPGNNLSGNTTNPILNAEGRDDGKHVVVLTVHDLQSHPEVHLTRAGVILIALLRGGDYDEGVPQIGVRIAYGLARCGFGDSLLNGMGSLKGKELDKFVANWRAEMVSELRSNSQGFLGRKQETLAHSFPLNFPNLDVISLYIDPITSGSQGLVPQFDWRRGLDVAALAGVCERQFGWGNNELLKRFGSLVWPGAALRLLREAILDAEQVLAGPEARPESSARATTGAPSLMSLVIGIRGQRTHISTDNLPELRVEINPLRFLQSAKEGLGGALQQLFVPPSIQPIRQRGLSHIGSSSTSSSKTGTDNATVAEQAATLRVWLPSCIVRLALPQLVSDHELGGAKQQAMKRRRDTDRTRDSNASHADAEHGSLKMARTSTDKTSPHDTASNRPKRADSPVIDLASASDGEVIVISDSDDPQDDGAARWAEAGAVVDLT